MINNALIQINDFRNSINLEPINLDDLDLDDKGVFATTSERNNNSHFSNGIERYARVLNKIKT